MPRNWIKSSLEGIREVARRAIIAHQDLPPELERVPLITVPIASRFDTLESILLSRWISQCAKELRDLYTVWLPSRDGQKQDVETRTLEVQEILLQTKLPYRSYYSYGEKLAVLEEDEIDPTSLAYAYHTLTALIANGPGNVPQLRVNRDTFVQNASRLAPEQKIVTRAGWHSLGGQLASSPSVEANINKCLEVFARSTYYGSLWRYWQRDQGADIWYSSTLAGDAYDPQVIANKDGRLEVFARGGENDLQHVWQVDRDSPHNWSEWATLGGFVQGSPTVAINDDGTLEVFVRGAYGALRHIRQNAPDSDGWGRWGNLGAPSLKSNLTTSLSSGINHPRVATNADGRLEVFALGSDGQLWHIANGAELRDLE